MKLKNCMWSLIAMSGLFVIQSCSDEPHGDDMSADNLKTEILPNGTTTTGAIFNNIDGTTFWLDYVKYKVVDSHLEIIGYDKTELPKVPKLYAEVTIDGATLKTRKISDESFNKAQCEKISVPKTITEIGRLCFADCTSLSSIILSEGITSISSGCFSHCTSLSSIVLPEGITSISSGCFAYCTSLSSIVLPEGITSIPASCFAYCTSLSSIVLPKGITSLGIDDYYNLFWGECFYGCTSLSSIVLPEGITSLPPSCFANCTSLSSIVLPEGIMGIDSRCFSECTSLSSIVLPKGLTEISENCFEGCTSLNAIYFQSTNPPTIYNSSSLHAGFSKFIAYVPRESLELYKNKYRYTFKEILPSI